MAGKLPDATEKDLQLNIVRIAQHDAGIVGCLHLDDAGMVDFKSCQPVFPLFKFCSSRYSPGNVVKTCPSLVKFPAVESCVVVKPDEKTSHGVHKEHGISTALVLVVGRLSLKSLETEHSAVPLSGALNVGDCR